MSDWRVVPFRRWHYEWLSDSNPTADGGFFTPVDSILAQLEGANSWTGVYEGSPVACGGTLQHWVGRHQAWMYMGKNTAPYMVLITKAVLAQLAKVEGRIELTVRSDFPQGQRWARMLGFEVESPRLVKFGPQGEDHIGFVRVN